MLRLVMNDDVYEKTVVCLLCIFSHGVGLWNVDVLLLDSIAAKVGWALQGTRFRKH
jgi:hypothetical protein